MFNITASDVPNTCLLPHWFFWSINRKEFNEKKFCKLVKAQIMNKHFFPFSIHFVCSYSRVETARDQSLKNTQHWKLMKRPFKQNQRMKYDYFFFVSTTQSSYIVFPLTVFISRNGNVLGSAFSFIFLFLYFFSVFSGSGSVRKCRG